MKRPLTTSFAAPPPSPTAPAEPDAPPTPPAPTWREVAPIVAALIGTLESIETGPKAGPAMKAHRSALRRQGQAAAALGGPEAMAAVLEQVGGADALRADRRLAIVREAWAGLPDWPADALPGP
jgi:hypothetical protein